MELVIKGIVKQTSEWTEIAAIEAAESATIDDINKVVDQLKSAIKNAFDTGEPGYVTVNNTIINIQSFAVISMDIKEQTRIML